MAAKKQMTPTCPQCGHTWDPRRPHHVDFRIGESLTGDVMFAGHYVLGRAKDGNVRAQAVTRILDGLWLALYRDDDRQLQRLDTAAKRYLETRQLSERHDDAWLEDSPTIVRELVRIAGLEFTVKSKTPFGHMLSRVVARFFPYLSGVETVAKLDKLVEALQTERERVKGDAERLAERALVHAGMPGEEAHRRFAFLRVAASRARA